MATRIYNKRGSFEFKNTDNTTNRWCVRVHVALQVTILFSKPRARLNRIYYHLYMVVKRNPKRTDDQ